MPPVDTFRDFLVLRTLRYFKKYVAPYFKEVWQVDHKLYANKSLLYNNKHTPMQVASDLHLHVDLPQVSNKYSTYLISPLLIVDTLCCPPSFDAALLERDNMPHPSLVAACKFILRK